MPLEDRVLVVYPWKGNAFAGGPEGFVTQLLRPFQHPRFGVTPAIAPPTLNGWIKQQLQHPCLPSVSGWSKLLKRPGLLRSASVFRDSGMAAAKYLWFVEHNHFALFEPYIRDDQVVIYQPHSPVLPWEEMSTDTPEDVKIRDATEALTRRLMQRTSILILPNAGAQSIYASLVQPHHDVCYLQSGAALPLNLSAIPLDPQMSYFLYIGRRCHVKGFDIVRAAFAKARTSRPDLRLILCGDGEAVRDDGVIDVGFTTRIHDWIASADCVINANRQSYLDLSVMETLAIGTPIVMTATHGHSMFRNFNTTGIRCLNGTDPEELAGVLAGMSSSELRKAEPRTENQTLYRQEFSVAAYQNRLTAFIDHLDQRAQPAKIQSPSRQTPSAC